MSSAMAVPAPGAAVPARRHNRRPVLHPRVADIAAVAVGLGLGASAALPLSNTSLSALKAPGAWAILAGDVTAMTGTYLLLVMVLLAARIAPLEKVLGQDKLVRWHRRLSSAPLLLLTAHAVLTTLGYAESAHVGLMGEAGSLITTMRWVLAAVVAYAMFVLIAGASIRAVRRRFNYDTWWVIHLYTYLALAFSVPHQIFEGTDFVGHPWAKVAWALLWLATAGVVIVYRLGLPAWRSLRHQLRVAWVKPEGHGVYAVVLEGRRLERLRVAGGQYFAWRFMTRGLWWHAHPFSISAVPAPPYLRVTLKVQGDATAAIVGLRPGTRVAVEGPYGAFTSQARTRRKVALVAAGLGVTPVRALLEDLPTGVDPVVLHRATSEAHLVHQDELKALVATHHGRWVPLVGPRDRHPLHDPRYLHRLIPDIATRDLYICGPDDFSEGVAQAAQALGTAPEAVHRESFEF
jgi:predicted ferric reductase